MGRILIGNIKGPQGEAGKNFEYAKTYASVSAMNADFSGTDVDEGEYVVISAGIDDADNGRVYRKGTNSYVYVNRVNGPTGPRGATGPMPTLVNNLNTTTAGQGALDAAVGPTIDGKVTGNGGEAGDTIATFTTSDTTTDAEIIEYTDMAKLTSGSPLKTLMSIMSKAVKNVRWFQKLLGTTDISGIGNGTVTNAVSTLNDAFTWHSAGSITGGSSILIPATWKEANIRVGLGGTRFYFFSIIKLQFNFGTATSYPIKGGHYQDSGNFSHVQVNFSTQTSGAATVVIGIANLSGNDLLSSSTLQIIYR